MLLGLRRNQGSLGAGASKVAVNAAKPLVQHAAAPPGIVQTSTQLTSSLLEHSRVHPAASSAADRNTNKGSKATEAI